MLMALDMHCSFLRMFIIVVMTCFFRLFATKCEGPFSQKNPRRKLAHVSPDVGPCWLCSRQWLTKTKGFRSECDLKENHTVACRAIRTMSGGPFLEWEADPRHAENTETLGARRAKAKLHGKRCSRYLLGSREWCRDC